MSEVVRKRVLVADRDPVVAFIASHILSRSAFHVDTVTSAAEFLARGDGYDAVVISDSLVPHVRSAFDPDRAVILGDAVPGMKAYARLPKPLELEVLVSTVGACASRRPI